MPGCALHRWEEWVLDSQVKFERACTEPHPSAGRQGGRLGELRHAQRAAVERAGGVLRPCGHRELYVVQRHRGRSFMR